MDKHLYMCYVIRVYLYTNMSLFKSFIMDHIMIKTKNMIIK